MALYLCKSCYVLIIFTRLAGVLFCIIICFVFVYIVLHVLHIILCLLPYGAFVEYY